MNYQDTQLSQIATRFVNSTNQSIFLTGKAGTGKTTFLKNIIKNTHKQAIIAAPTGIAAINAGGVTLHSLFQLPFGAFIPTNLQFNEEYGNFALNTPQSLMKNFQMHSNKRTMIKEMELLIIDEVSMLRADLLDAIDVILRSVRRRRDKVFGGVQVLFIGDLLQLPPVVKEHEWQFLKQYYKSPFFFEAQALQQNKPVYIELDKVFRQSDHHFINILNHFRENKVNKTDINELNKHYFPDFDPETNKGIINLTTHNYKADNINKTALEKLKGKEFKYYAEIIGDFRESNYPIDETLLLKVGAQVMFIKNDPSGEHRFFNGKIGEISALSDEDIEVKFADSPETVFVEKYIWENKRYSLNKETNEIEEKVEGKFIHFPIKLAWAITVHKSQGLTFEKAVIDVNDAFAQGQVYVALSRLTSLDGLILKSKINYESFGINASVEQFSSLKVPVPKLNEIYNQASLKYINEFVLNAFNFDSLKSQIVYHINSYNKDKNRSTKQKYNSWARQIDKDFNSTVDISKKFQNQINRIIFSHSENTLETLKERVVSADKYFAPILKANSVNILEHINKIKTEKSIKKYITELQILELHFLAQSQKIKKAIALIEASLNNTSLNEKIETDEIKKRKLTKEDKTSNTSKSSKKPKNQKIPKEKKIPTKVQSFNLFKQGKSIEEIALERDLKPQTILNHLASYIKTGEIKATSFLSQEKINIIIKVRNKLNVMNLTPIKEELGNEFTFSEIRIALADYKFKNNIENEN